MRPLKFSRAVVAVRGLQAKFSVICRAFSLLYSVHDFAHLNSFELADDLEKKWVVQITNALHVLIADISFLYPICVLISRFLFKRSAMRKIDEICETTAAEEFKSLFHLTCWLSAPGASLDSQGIRAKKRERTVRKRKMNIIPLTITSLFPLTAASSSGLFPPLSVSKGCALGTRLHSLTTWNKWIHYNGRTHWLTATITDFKLHLSAGKFLNSF